MSVNDGSMTCRKIFPLFALNGILDEGRVGDELRSSNLRVAIPKASIFDIHEGSVFVSLAIAG
jgi:hypothetical protein